MKRENLLQYFEKINIDKLNIAQLQNLNITHIPALLIIYPNNNKVLVQAKQAFEWINNLLQNRRININKMINLNRQKLLQKNKEINNNNILEFSKDEMNGCSDDYAYLVADIAQPKSFQQYGRDGDTIITYNEGEKINTNEINKELDKKKKEREIQNTNLKKIMENGQKEAVYENTMMK